MAAILDGRAEVLKELGAPVEGGAKPTVAAIQGPAWAAAASWRWPATRACAPRVRECEARVRECGARRQEGL